MGRACTGMFLSSDGGRRFGGMNCLPNLERCYKDEEFLYTLCRELSWKSGPRNRWIVTIWDVAFYKTKGYYSPRVVYYVFLKGYGFATASRYSPRPSALSCMAERRTYLSRYRLFMNQNVHLCSRHLFCSVFILTGDP